VNAVPVMYRNCPVVLPTVADPDAPPGMSHTIAYRTNVGVVVWAGIVTVPNARTRRLVVSVVAANVIEGRDG
jgi:hypothetical protein